MKKINNNVIIASVILNSNKKILDIEEIFDSVKNIRLNLKSKNYFVEPINIEYIDKFFRIYPHFGKKNNDKIVLKNNIDEKLKTHFLKNIDESTLELLKKQNKFILPVIVDDKLFLYHFFDNINILESIKSNFYYDGVKNDSYIVDLELLNNSEINTLLEEVKFIKKEEFNYDIVNKYIEILYELNNKKFENVEYYFSINESSSNLKIIYEVLIYYLHKANNNKLKLENDENFKKLT